MALISIRKTAAIEPAPTDTVSLYVDASDNHLKQIDENGNIIDLTDGSAASSPNAASLVNTTKAALFTLLDDGLANIKATYRITDATDGIIRVTAKTASLLTATAMKEGSDDGAGTVTQGEWGNYDLDADVFTSGNDLQTVTDSGNSTTNDIRILKPTIEIGDVLNEAAGFEILMSRDDGVGNNFSVKIGDGGDTFFVVNSTANGNAAFSVTTVDGFVLGISANSIIQNVSLLAQDKSTQMIGSYYNTFNGVPSVNEDSAKGYVANESILRDYNTQIEYLCTSSSAGAAAWKVATPRIPHSIFTPLTGATVTTAVNQTNIINPAGALLALTINLPSSPVNNDFVEIKFTQAITTVTYGGGTVLGGIVAPILGTFTKLTYDAGTSTWY